MAEVCLVQMPYGALERPSLPLGILQASLQREGIGCRSTYPNLWFASEIGLEVYQAINLFSFNTLLGEWTFALTAFDDEGRETLSRENYPPGPFPRMGSDEEYFGLPMVDSEVGTFKRLGMLARAPAGARIEDAFARVREMASPFVDRTARRILDGSPRIVGCTSTFQQHCPSLALLRRIRELSPDVVTMLGGANCEGVMGLGTHRSFPWVDYVVSGEADLLFPDLVQKILAIGRHVPQADLPFGVLGPELREKPDLVGQPPRVVLHRLDEVPIPNYDDYFAEVESSELRPYMRFGLPMETARGCWWGAKSHCTFCGLNGDGMGFRSKSPERVLEEFEVLAERYEISDFNVVDNILDMRYLKTVVPQLAADKAPYFAFWETKANLKKTQVEELAAAGIRFLQPGIESLHQGPLDLIGKGCTPMVNLQLLKWALGYGVSIEWLFLFGFPGEKDEWYGEMAAWLPLAYHLHHPGSIVAIQFHRFSPYHSRAEEFGLRLAPERQYEHVYPLRGQALSDIAFYFDDLSYRQGVFELSPGEERPALMDFQRAVLEWRNAWMRQDEAGDSTRPRLDYSEVDGNRWTILDTRPCAVATEHRLSWLETEVMKAADGGVSLAKLRRGLSKVPGFQLDQEAVDSVLDELLSRRLMLSLDGQFLALAVPADRPPMPNRFPGGNVNVEAYLQDQVMAAAASNRLPMPRRKPAAARPPRPGPAVGAPASESPAAHRPRTLSAHRSNSDLSFSRSSAPTLSAPRGHEPQEGSP